MKKRIWETIFENLIRIDTLTLKSITLNHNYKDSLLQLIVDQFDLVFSEEDEIFSLCCCFVALPAVASVVEII